MGGLLPNTDDMDIINQLNSAFSEPKLGRLRTHIHTNHDDNLLVTDICIGFLIDLRFGRNQAIDQKADGSPS
jgi:hypothetical protein